MQEHVFLWYMYLFFFSLFQQCDGKTQVKGRKKNNKRVVWKHQSITMAQLEAWRCCKNIDIYHGTLEGTQDIMGLTKSPNYSGGLWMWHCYVTICSKIYSQLLFLLFLFPPSIPPICLFSFIFTFPSHSFFSFFLTSHLSIIFFPSSTHFVFTQLHQLRRHMSATAIMPFEGTTEDEERDWTGDGGAVSWGSAKRKKEPSFFADWPKNRRTDRAPNGIQAWDILYCSASNHREVGPHKQPVSVPASPLLTAHWSYHELTCFKKKKETTWKKVTCHRTLWWTE